MEFNSINDVRAYYQEVGRLALTCSAYYISVSKSKSGDKVVKTFILREKPFNHSDRVVLSASSLEEVQGKLKAMLKATQCAMENLPILQDSDDKYLEIEYFPKSLPNP